MILAIDPGTTQSAYMVLDEKDYSRHEFAELPNDAMLARIAAAKEDYFVIEMVASYGMAVGATVFETVFWIGRFFETAVKPFTEERCNRIKRMDEKLALCFDSRAKDSNINVALKDRFGQPGTKKKPGPLFGVVNDIWAALAVAVTFADILNGEYKPKEI
jgi:hypothetical protein